MDYLAWLPLAASREAPSTDPCITIDDVCNAVDNGDVLLFSGESQLSAIVTLFCGSQWSHVGIVYRASERSDPMLFESVKSDDNTDNPVGVRLLPLRKALMDFRGNAVAMRALCIPTSIVQADKGVEKRWRDHMRESMQRCIEEHRGKKYETRTLNFIFARFTSLSIHYETRERLFCSELVAICYQEAGILYNAPSCIQFIPDDFCEAGSVDLQLPSSVSFHTINHVPVKLGPQLFIQLERRVDDDDDDDDDDIIV